MSAIPEGWRLVPATPTQEMCQRGQWKAREWPKFPLRLVPIWEAMLAAAPEPPVDQRSKLSMTPPLTAAMDNVLASVMGKCASEAGDPKRTDVGDSIDRGLILLRLLVEKGFSVRHPGWNTAWDTTQPMKD